MPSTRSVVAVAAALLLAGCQAAPTPASPPPSPTNAPPTVTAPPAASPTPASTPTGTWIHLTPDDGSPGAPFQIEGYLPGGPTAAEAEGDATLQHTTLCWDGCLTGFTAVDVPVQWSADEAGRFTISFNAPSVPWWGPQGPRPVEDGDYVVGVQCLGPIVPGCATQEAQATATFQLAGAEPGRCSQGQPCAELTLAPSQAQPGDTVEISGWAPIIETISGQPFGYTLAIDVGGAGTPASPIGTVTQQVDGELSGEFTVPQSVPGTGALSSGNYDVLLQASTPQTVVIGQGGPTVTRASLTLGASVTWNSLRFGAPIWLAPTADLVTPAVSVDPQDPQRLAYCAPNTIRLSSDGGQTWQDVPINGAVDAIDQLGFEIMSGGATGGTPQCIAVTLDTAHPQSLYAVFAAAERQMGAPPEFFKGLFTDDGGASWETVPAPGASYDFPFGGFAGLPGGRIEALFNLTGSGGPAVQVETTQDGGATWSPRSPSCPHTAPCLRWGPAPGSISGMGAPRPQSLLRSTDAGQNWSVTDITLDLHAGVAGEAAGFADGSALVLAGQEAFPARWSRDGGATWTTVALPALPGQGDARNSFPALQFLPDGSLVALGPDGGWKGLPPAGQSWCSLSGNRLPNTSVRFASAGDAIWWLDPSTGTPAHTSLAAAMCTP